jgi:predicted nucleotidyltransferase
MGTIASLEMLSSALFGKTRRALLALFYSHPDQSFYVREVARAVRVGQGAVQRELKRLCDAGVVTRSRRGAQVYYQADRRCPIFEELRRIVLKTAGVAEVVRGALAPYEPKIVLAFVFGSVASGSERADSDVDLLVVGDVAFAEVVSALAPVQEAIGREVNPSVYPVREFRRKLADGHHFLKTVVAGAKVFIVGDERALGRLVE